MPTPLKLTLRNDIADIYETATLDWEPEDYELPDEDETVETLELLRSDICCERASNGTAVRFVALTPINSNKVRSRCITEGTYLEQVGFVTISPGLVQHYLQANEHSIGAALQELSEEVSRSIEEMFDVALINQAEQPRPRLN